MSQEDGFKSIGHETAVDQVDEIEKGVYSANHDRRHELFQGLWKSSHHSTPVDDFGLYLKGRTDETLTTFYQTYSKLLLPVHCFPFSLALVLPPAVDPTIQESDVISSSSLASKIDPKIHSTVLVSSSKAHDSPVYHVYPDSKETNTNQAQSIAALFEIVKDVLSINPDFTLCVCVSEPNPRSLPSTLQATYKSLYGVPSLHDRSNVTLQLLRPFLSYSGFLRESSRFSTSYRNDESILSLRDSYMSITELRSRLRPSLAKGIKQAGESDVLCVTWIKNLPVFSRRQIYLSRSYREFPKVESLALFYDIHEKTPIRPKLVFNSSSALLSFERSLKSSFTSREYDQELKISERQELFVFDIFYMICQLVLDDLDALRKQYDDQLYELDHASRTNPTRSRYIYSMILKDQLDIVLLSLNGMRIILTPPDSKQENAEISSKVSLTPRGSNSTPCTEKALTKYVWSCQTTSCGNQKSSLIDDIDFLKAEFESQILKYDKVQESMRSLGDFTSARSTIILGFLGFIYIPLSFASSYYGMNLQEINGGKYSNSDFITFAAIAITISLSVAGLLSYFSLSVSTVSRLSENVARTNIGLRSFRGLETRWPLLEIGIFILLLISICLGLIAFYYRQSTVNVFAIISRIILSALCLTKALKSYKIKPRDMISRCRSAAWVIASIFTLVSFSFAPYGLTNVHQVLIPVLLLPKSRFLLYMRLKLFPPRKNA